jgi:hypothetical protein
VDSLRDLFLRRWTLSITRGAILPWRAKRLADSRG